MNKKNMKKRGKSHAHFCLPLLIVFSFSCSQSIIDEEDMLRMNDTLNPEVFITKPLDGSFYAALVAVEGSVEDWADDKGTRGVVNSTITYEIVGTDVKKAVSLHNEDTFGFTFPTTGFTGEKTLKITARDWNGNTGSAVLKLKEGAFPAFSAQAGNRQIILNWEPVALAEKYTLFYTDDGTTPSETNMLKKIETADTSLVLAAPGNQMENGRLYSFLLKATSSGSYTSWSDVIRQIPVSPFTLAPRITGGYKKITLEWNAIPGTQNFIVARAPAKEGPFIDLRYTITGNSFTDTGVEDGVLYYYTVRTVLEGSIPGGINSGETVPVPPFGLLLGSFTTPNAYDLTINNNLALILDKTAGLLLADISIPAQPSFKGVYSALNNPNTVRVYGTLAYIADDAAGLRMIDISNPGSPVLAATFDTPGFARDVAVNGGYAYIADRDTGLQVVNVSVPGTPEPAGSYNTAGAAYGIALNGNFAYVADGPAGLAIIDISDPGAPSFAASCDTNGCANDVEVAGNYVYLADGASGLSVIDIGNPAAPSPVPYSSCDTAGNAVKINVDGNYAYLADETGGMTMIDISRPNLPAIAGNYDITRNIDGVAVSGRFCFLACQGAGMQIINIGSPRGMEEAAAYAAVPGVNGTAVSGDYAYLADPAGTLQVLDISEPGAPAWLAAYPIPGAGIPYDVAVCGDYAFVTGIGMGVQIVSVADPAHPSLAGSISISDDTNGVALLGDYLYVGYWDNTGISGVKIFNIADREAPLAAGSYTVAGYTKGIAVKGDYAFTADYDAGVHVTDIGSLPDTKPVTSIAVSDRTSAIALTGDYAVVTDGAAGVRLLDIENPQFTKVLSAANTPGFANDVALCGYYALSAEASGIGGYAGLQVIDISRPAGILLIGGLATGTESRYITTRGKYGYLSLAGQGLRIYDLWPYTE